MVRPGWVTVDMMVTLDPGNTLVTVVPACVTVMVLGGTTEVIVVTEVLAGRVCVKVVTTPGSVVTEPGSVVTEPGSEIVTVFVTKMIVGAESMR